MIIVFQSKYYFAGQEDIQVSLAEGATIRDLKQDLATLRPDMFPDAMFAKYVVDGHIANDITELTDGCTVTMYLPMIGG